jgi:hypothetical protein
MECWKNGEDRGEAKRRQNPGDRRELRRRNSSGQGRLEMLNVHVKLRLLDFELWHSFDIRILTFVMVG